MRLILKDLKLKRAASGRVCRKRDESALKTLTTARNGVRSQGH